MSVLDKIADLQDLGIIGTINREESCPCPKCKTGNMYPTEKTNKSYQNQHKCLNCGHILYFDKQYGNISYNYAVRSLQCPNN